MKSILLLFAVILSSCSEKVSENDREILLNNLKADLEHCYKDLDSKIYSLGQHPYDTKPFYNVRPHIERTIGLLKTDAKIRTAIDSFKVFASNQDNISKDEKAFINESLDGIQGEEGLENLILSEIRYLRLLEKKIDDRFYFYDIVEPLVVTDKPEYRKGEVVTGKVYLTARSSTLKSLVYIGNPDSLIREENYRSMKPLQSNDLENFSTYNLKATSDTIQGVIIAFRAGRKDRYLPFKHTLRIK